MSGAPANLGAQMIELMTRFGEAVDAGVIDPTAHCLPAIADLDHGDREDLIMFMAGALVAAAEQAAESIGVTRQEFVSTMALVNLRTS